ncbi:efflux transporter outer membrane subunit [Allopusillimonas ginsengisoli]|uniref:efflux transporter outer membrane subunit n=1 Tax=Allopusillimonas ginsengisoli TaxID=453575 RepID=UPI0010201AD3|nr:efflux transporter outer membrane subunit [Allopusillimonas ginsengisoli]TEA80176.1 efflux transporter outer membrane subunit [Allopusillimonas ginsengisoli]
MNALRGIVVGALALSGCTVPPSPPASAPQLPERWRQVSSAQASPSVSAPALLPAGAPGDTRDWWQSFGSGELNRLIAIAQTQSLEIATAVARVQRAEASARLAGATLLPDLSAGVEAGRQGRLGGDAWAEGTRYAVGLNAQYELDLWGRNRADYQAALASVQASRFDQQSVLLTVTAGTASAWIQAVSLRERLGVSQLNLQSAERVLQLVQSQVEAGSAMALALAQQRTLVAQQQRQVHALRQQAQQATTALALLLGQAGDMTLATDKLDALSLPSINAGLPSALLLRRPDIAAGEARLSAASADVAAARAALMPSLSLSGYVGGGGQRLSQILENPLYSLAASLTAPIFNAGRLAAGRDLAQADREALLAQYRQSIVAAFADVQVALDARAGLQAQELAQQEALVQAEAALALADARYREGAETLLVLLDAQRSLYAAQDEAIQIRAARLQNAVDLYRALGGGWQRETTEH